MMKRLFLSLLFLTTIFIPLHCLTLCQEGCRCSNDDPCEYYCHNGQCQPEIRSGSKCSGHHIHPRECGYYYCDPDSKNTCQSTKSYGVMCNTSWSCYTDYCDSTLKTCQHKPYSPSNSYIELYILIPVCVVIFITVLATIIFIKRVRARRLALIHQGNTIVATIIRVYTVENSDVCEESPPPAYSQAVANSIPNNTNANEHPTSQNASMRN